MYGTVTRLYMVEREDKELMIMGWSNDGPRTFVRGQNLLIYIIFKIWIDSTQR